MLVTTSVTVKVTSRNADRLRSLFGDLELGSFVSGDTTLVLGKDSKVTVDVECDVCGKVRCISYAMYFKAMSETGSSTCPGRCSTEKRKKTVRDRYGVDNVFQLQEIKNKSSDASVMRWGTPYPMQSKECQRKCRETNLKVHGVEYPMQSDEVKAKSVETCLKVYGERTSLLDPVVVKKGKETKISEYGTDVVSDIPGVIEKRAETRMRSLGKKYNMEFVARLVHITLHSRNVTHYREVLRDPSLPVGRVILVSPDQVHSGSKVKVSVTCDSCGSERMVEVRTMQDPYLCPRCKWRKTRETNLSNTGYENPFSSPTVQAKIVEINLERWGDSRPSRNPEVSGRIGRSVSDTKAFGTSERLGLDVTGREGGSYLVRCPKGHEYVIEMSLLYNRLRYGLEPCTVCFPPGSMHASRAEGDLARFVQSVFGGEIRIRDRTVIKGYELDVFVPELRLGIEYNGVFWHSEARRPKDYHIRKTESFRDVGVRLIHVWEDDWRVRRSYVESLVRHVLGVPEVVMSATNCSVIEIGRGEADQFMIEYGPIWATTGVVRLGLRSPNGEVVSILSLKRSKSSSGGLVVCGHAVRTGYEVRGGGAVFLQSLSDRGVGCVVWPVDLSTSTGDSLLGLGFVDVGQRPPRGMPIVGGVRRMRGDGPKVFDCGRRIMVKNQS